MELVIFSTLSTTNSLHRILYRDMPIHPNVATTQFAWLADVSSVNLVTGVDKDTAATRWVLRTHRDPVSFLALHRHPTAPLWMSLHWEGHTQQPATSPQLSPSESEGK